MPRFTNMEKTTFGELYIGWDFYLPNVAQPIDEEGAPVTEPAAMRDLDGPYRKVRKSARQLGRTDVDGNVMFSVAETPEGDIIPGFGPRQVVWVHKDYIDLIKEDIPF